MRYASVLAFLRMMCSSKKKPQCFADKGAGHVIQACIGG